MYWSVTLDGCPSVCVTTDELRSNKKFLNECIEQLRRKFVSTPKKAWATLIDQALRQQSTEEGEPKC